MTATTEISLDNGTQTMTFSAAGKGVQTYPYGSRVTLGSPPAGAGGAFIGEALVPRKVSSVQTCSATLLGATVVVGGGANEGAVKECRCTSDGAASPTYKWCSLGLQSGTYTCVGGTTTACP
jgi:hypothetical protein